MQVRLDGCRDGLVLVAEDLDRLQWDAGQMNLVASDALAAVRRGAQMVEFRELRQLVGGAGKSAAREQVFPELGAQTLDEWAVLAADRLPWEAVQQAVAAPDKPGAAPSGAQSCADLTLAAEEEFGRRVFELGLT